MPERDWLYEMLEGMRQDQRDGLAQLRLDMNKGFDQLWGEAKIQNGRVRTSEERLTVIETERRQEDKLAAKRGAVAGIVASAGLAGLIEAIKAYVSKP